MAARSMFPAISPDGNPAPYTDQTLPTPAQESISEDAVA